MKKKIVITGASSGIGFALSKLLVEQGHTVFAISRNESRLSSLASSLSSASLHLLVGDISKQQSLQSIHTSLAGHTDHIDALINNAGTLIHKPFSELTFQNWLDIYSTNVFGAAMLTSALLPLLKRPDAKEKSHVVNIASMGGVQGSTKFAGLSAYSSSKGALCNFTECLAEELKNDGVAVNALAIGSVATEMFSAAFPGFKAATTPEKMAEFIAEFTLTGQNFFNGKILPVSNSTP